MKYSNRWQIQIFSHKLQLMEILILDWLVIFKLFFWQTHLIHEFCYKCFYRKFISTTRMCFGNISTNECLFRLADEKISPFDFVCRDRNIAKLSKLEICRNLRTADLWYLLCSNYYIVVSFLVFVFKLIFFQGKKSWKYASNIMIKFGKIWWNRRQTKP